MRHPTNQTFKHSRSLAKKETGDKCSLLRNLFRPLSFENFSDSLVKARRYA
jgi:hypothetical protein